MSFSGDMPALTKDQITQNHFNDKMDNPLDYLSVNYELYCNHIYSMSISQPTEYYKMRAVLLEALNKELLTHTHTIVFDLLRYGQIGTEKYTSTFSPQYPTELCNQISMSIAKSYQLEVKKIVKILLPPDFESLARSSLSTKTLANTIDRVSTTVVPTL